MTAIRIALASCCMCVDACAVTNAFAQDVATGRIPTGKPGVFQPPPVQKAVGQTPGGVPAVNANTVQLPMSAGAAPSKPPQTLLPQNAPPLLQGKRVAFGAASPKPTRHEVTRNPTTDPGQNQQRTLSYVGSLFFGGPSQTHQSDKNSSQGLASRMSSEPTSNEPASGMRVFPAVSRKQIPIQRVATQFGAEPSPELVLSPSNRVAANSGQVGATNPSQDELLPAPSEVASPDHSDASPLDVPSYGDLGKRRPLPVDSAMPFVDHSRPPGMMPAGRPEEVPAALATPSREDSIQVIGRRVASGRVLPQRTPVAIGLQDIVGLALFHAKALKVVRIQPAEAKQVVNQEFGQFDWNTFVETLFSSNANPVGNLSQTNLNLNQVRNDENRVDVGVRKQTLTGGQLELRQSLGAADSNSGLLDPEEPGNARISITYSQEFLRDGGQDVVLGQALIASLNAEVAHADAFAQMSDVLRDVLAQYWNLYQARGDYFVQLSLVEWARETLDILEARRQIDAERNSIEQARALWLEARANLENARANVLTAQDQLYRLVNAPEIDSNTFELLLTEEPQSTSRPLDVLVELQEGIRFRAEVAQKLVEIRAAAVTHHISLNQLLPRLTFSIESSLNGIDENRDFWGAFRNTTDIDPSYAANVAFEFPIGNHTAKAQNKQARLTLQRLQFEYEDQIEQVRLDIAAAIRTLNASNTILEQRRLTLSAREEEIEYLRIRRDVIPQDGASPSLLLEQLFQAINRQVVSQQAYIAAVSDQQDAFAELLRAKGLLVNLSEIPRDILMAVPVPTRAFREQRSDRKRYKAEAYERAVLPGLARPIPNYR